MRSLSLFCLSAGGVFLAAGLMFAAQNHRLEGFQHSSPPPASAPPSPSAGQDSSQTGGTAQSFSPPPKPRPAAVGRLIERSDIKVRAAMPPQDYADLIEYLDEIEWRIMYVLTDMSKEEGDRIWEHMAETRLEKARNALNSGITPAARIAAEAALKQAQNQWLEEQIGPERFAKYRASLDISHRDDREWMATEGLARIERVVSLRPEQRNALHAGLLETALRTQSEKHDPLLGFRPHGKIIEGPHAPDIDAEAKAILTEEQWETYHSIKTIQQEGNDTMQGSIISMLPPILEAFQELMDEGTGTSPAPTPAPKPGPVADPSPDRPKGS